MKELSPKIPSWTKKRLYVTEIMILIIIVFVEVIKRRIKWIDLWSRKKIERAKERWSYKRRKRKVDWLQRRHREKWKQKEKGNINYGNFIIIMMLKGITWFGLNWSISNNDKPFDQSPYDLYAFTTGKIWP